MDDSECEQLRECTTNELAPRVNSEDFKRRITVATRFALEGFRGTVNNLLVLTYGRSRSMAILPACPHSLLLTASRKPERYTRRAFATALFFLYLCSPSNIKARSATLVTACSRQRWFAGSAHLLLFLLRCSTTIGITVFSTSSGTAAFMHSPSRSHTAHGRGGVSHLKDVRCNWDRSDRYVRGGEKARVEKGRERSRREWGETRAARGGSGGVDACASVNGAWPSVAGSLSLFRAVVAIGAPVCRTRGASVLDRRLRRDIRTTRELDASSHGLPGDVSLPLPVLDRSVLCVAFARK